MKSVKKIKVLVVDDSALVRRSLTDILSSDSDIGSIRTAADPYIAARKIKEEVPDVILLDIQMPRMDGLTFLRTIMRQRPIPVVICSTLAEKDSSVSLKALDYGAVELIQKPLLGTKDFFEESEIIVRDAVKAAAQARLSFKSSVSLDPKLTADVILKRPLAKQTIPSTEQVIVVGASTGGTEAIRVFLECMPLTMPGAVIVQHMPEHFTESFAQRLNSICDISVKEATNGDSVLPGLALIAPGNKHILLNRNGSRYSVEVKNGPLVCRHRPSVDVLFRSAAKHAGKNAVGIIMTGMGDDGALGMLEMKESGAFTVAQDESSCTVFGMPKEAIELGGVQLVLPLNTLAEAVLKACSRSS